jgi:hypothetical protein
MFCPRCGQQAAEEVRFCSRCGLPLAAAAEIVAAEGRPDRLAEREEGGGTLTPRQRGTRKGLMLMAGGLIFFVVAALLTVFKEDLFVFLVPAGILTTIGFMRMLYGLLLEEHGPTKKAAKRAAAGDAAAGLKGVAPHGGELPPERAVPAALYAKTSAGTSDMAARPSVTESTTQLIDEQNRGR